jgi:hypothetical protein
VARGKSKFCASHGGGQPCRVVGCPTAAVSNNLYCRKHRAILRYELGDRSSVRVVQSSNTAPLCVVVPPGSHLSPSYSSASSTAGAEMNFSFSSSLLPVSSLLLSRPESHVEIHLPPPPTISGAATKVGGIKEGSLRNDPPSRPLLFQAEDIDAAMILQSMYTQGSKLLADAASAHSQRSLLASLTEDVMWTGVKSDSNKRKEFELRSDEINRDSTPFAVPGSPSTTEEGSSSDFEHHSHDQNPIAKKARVDRLSI